MRLWRLRLGIFGWLGFCALLLLTGCNVAQDQSDPAVAPSSDPSPILALAQTPPPLVQVKSAHGLNPVAVAQPPLAVTSSPRHPETAIRNVTYCTGGGEELKMDIAMPTHPGSFPAPVALFVHGGTWQSGDKSSGGLVGMLTTALTNRGYIVAAANYRLAPKYRFPAQIEDVKCAVRYLRASAQRYHLNPQLIGAWGDSAGGHLVSLLGVTDSSAGFDGGGGYDDQSSAVEAVVDMFGRVDIAASIQPDGTLLKRLQPVFDMQNARRASPIDYVTKNAPPFLIIHGEKDALVPFSQSVRFYNTLKRAGVDATLLPVMNAGHEFVMTGGPMNPTLPQIVQEVVSFFDRHLKTAQS